MPLISVIVPVYNVEKYIDKCIYSIKNQNFKDFECLIIDDGSEDKSIEVAKRIIENDQRFKIIHKQNGGYGSVIEVAISEYKGDYLLICDPDDYLCEEALFELYSIANDTGADITAGTRTLIYENNNNTVLDLMYSEDETRLINNHVYEKEDDNFRDILLINCAPHSKLYSRRSIKSVPYPHHCNYTDNILFYLACSISDKIAYTEKPYAFYLQDRFNNTVTAIKSKYIEDHIIVYKKIVEHLEEDAETNEIIYYLIFYHFKILFYNMKYLNDCADDKRNKIIKELYELLSLLKNHKDVIIKYQNIY